MYHLLSEASSDRHYGSPEEGEKFYVPKKHTGSTISRRWINSLFLLSVITNFALPIYFLHTPMEHVTLEKSRFAGLTRNIPLPWTRFNIANDTEQEKLWDETNYDKGNIALDDDYARAMGLPRAQRFPWNKSKGIYLINAYHNLHCVKTLRTGIVEFQSGSKQSSNFSHLIHCLNVLRDEIRCEASDTPRYTGYQPDQKSGLGQVRMCRDWKQLENWAVENTACWRHIGDIKDPGFRELERYRFCPPGSPYEELAKTAWLHHEEH